MVNLIIGQKGSGKTKRLVKLATEALENSKGNIIFIDDDKRYLREIPSSVRFVDISEYGVDSADGLFGFICGMYAQNYDIGAIYVDAFLKIIGAQPKEVEKFFKKLSAFCEQNNIHAVFSVSADVAQAPDFLKDWII